VGSTGGVILDVACGPGTYGRRVASKSRTIYGIDASMSMLRRGVRYVERDHIPNVHFARAKVEALPFQGGLFDAAICAGSLNHFSDTVFALREIGRTMKYRRAISSGSGFSNFSIPDHTKLHSYAALCDARGSSIQ
jgi:ubiquinone/menaquinone biosynthesis C-methylase UbiE